MSKRLRLGMLILVAAALSACSSSGPATKYYALFPAGKEQLTVAADSGAKLPSIGIGPVKVAGYLDKSAIVSRTKDAKIIVSGYHAWAEPLSTSIPRIVASNLSTLLQKNNVIPFPWDMRNRPELQVQISVDQLDGIRGQSVTMEYRWFIYSNKEGKVLSEGREQLSQDLDSSSYEDYAKAINVLLTEASKTLAEKLSG